MLNGKCGSINETRKSMSGKRETKVEKLFVVRGGYGQHPFITGKKVCQKGESKK